MMAIALKGQQIGSQVQLGQLLATNKSLAKQKREVHLKKLRVYSQKMVKLKQMLRQSEDNQQRRCIENKLRLIQQKQNAQIHKLSKIEQIERQIDQFITDESQQSNINTKNKSNNIKPYRDSFMQPKIINIQNTPAQRLRTKSSVQPVYYENHQETNNARQKSNKNGSFSKKQQLYDQSDQWLLSSSKQALSQLSVDNNQSKKHKICKIPQKKIIQFDVQRQNQSIEDHIIIKNSYNPACQTQNYMFNIQIIPVNLTLLVDKVSKSFTKQLPTLISYITEAQNIKKQYFLNYHKTSQALLQTNYQQQKIKQDVQLHEDKIKQIKKQTESLIQKQRSLMEKIDSLQYQHRMITKKISNALTMIKKSKDIIIQSCAYPFQQADQNSHSFDNSKSAQNNISSKISVDSNQSVNSQSLGPLSHQLNLLQHLIEKFLLAAERKSMTVIGEIQQISLKMNRTKQQTIVLQSKKKYLQSQIMRLQKNLSSKGYCLNELKQSYQRVQNETKDLDVVHNLKRNLISELEDKCDKLKNKKKGIVDKIKKVEEDLQPLTVKINQKQHLFANLERQSQKLQQRKEELQKTLIFKQRQIEKKKKEGSELDKIKSHLQIKNRQIIKLNQQLTAKINENQLYLGQISSRIATLSSQQINVSERVRNMQLQLAQSVSLLDQQNCMISKQKQQLTLKSSEYLELQKKISLSSTNILGLQTEQSRIQQRIKALSAQCQQQQAYLQKIKTVKQDLQAILTDVLSKKQVLFAEVQQKTAQLDILIQDLEHGQSDLSQVQICLGNLTELLSQKQAQHSSVQSKISALKNELDQHMEQENNILERISKLRQMQKHILIESGIKGLTNYMEGDLKSRVSEAVAELSSVQDLKTQLKECKYQNRKLRLDNQRLVKLLQDEGRQIAK